MAIGPAGIAGLVYRPEFIVPTPVKQGSNVSRIVAGMARRDGISMDDAWEKFFALNTQFDRTQMDGEFSGPRDPNKRWDPDLVHPGDLIDTGGPIVDQDGTGAVGATPASFSQQAQLLQCFLAILSWLYQLDRQSNPDEPVTTAMPQRPNGVGPLFQNVTNYNHNVYQAAAPAAAVPAGPAPTEAVPTRPALTEAAPTGPAPTEAAPAGPAPTEAAPAGPTPTGRLHADPE